MNTTTMTTACAADDTTTTWLAIVAGVLTLVSEGLPFTEKIKHNGLCHAIWSFVCESGCLKNANAITNNDHQPGAV